MTDEKLGVWLREGNLLYSLDATAGKFARKPVIQNRHWVVVNCRSDVPPQERTDVFEMFARAPDLLAALRETRNVLQNAVNDDLSSTRVSMAPWWLSRVGIAIERIDAAIKDPTP